MTDRAGADARPLPAAFLPIPRHWPQRAALGSTYDETWQRTRAPLLPADLDPLHWQSAPPDQQVDPEALMGQILRITNVSTAAPVLDVPIPLLDFEVSTRTPSGWFGAPVRVQTLRLDTEALCLTLVFGAFLRLPKAQMDVEVKETVVVMQRGDGFRVRPEDASRFAVGPSSGQSSVQSSDPSSGYDPSPEEVSA